MTTTTLTTTSTVDSLIGAYRSHVFGRTLPTPVMLNVTPGLRVISVQPGGTDVTSRLANVLVWAYTLADVTAQWWHTPDQWLHVNVTGRTSGGARMRVSAGGSFDAFHGLVPLTVNESENVSLDELYTLVGLLREAQQETRQEGQQEARRVLQREREAV
jgi:hypothetical protein